MNIHTIIGASIVASMLLYPLATNAQIEPEDPPGDVAPKPAPSTLNTERPGIPLDIESVVDPQNFFDETFDFFRSQPAVQDSADRLTQDGAFDEANEAIGERIGVNPVDILKAFVRAIIWVLESGVAFFSQLVR